MKWYRSLAYLGAAAIAFSLFGITEADASTARRDSLAGNQLIEDRNDIFKYPQLVVEHANLVGFDYGDDDNAGNGLLLMGDETAAFGISIHRGDLFDNQLFPYERQFGALGDIGTPLAIGEDFQQAGTIVDFFGGMDIGPGIVGARLALGRGNNSTDPADEDNDGIANGQTFAKLEAGYSMSGATTLDLSANITWAAAENEDNGEIDDDESMIGFGLSGRGYSDIGQPFELGYLGDFAFNRSSYTDVFEDDDDLDQSLTGFAAQAGLGPVWTIDDRATIAGYAVLGLARNTYDADEALGEEDVSVSLNSYVLPGFNVAADVGITDWLYFRSGAQYLWERRSISAEAADLDEESASRSGSEGDFSRPGAPSSDTDPTDLLDSPGGFGWNAGLGVEVGDFRFDGSLQHNFLLNGPNFIGGGSGFLALASAEYQWD